MRDIPSVIADTDTDTALSPKSRAPLRDVLEGVVFRLLGRSLWGKLYTLLSSLRSCLGHIRTELATGRESVSLGPSFERHHQSLRRNKRTLARRRGIEKLRATRPWVDFQDLEIFLAGFDAAEQWICDKTDKEPDLH
jgi:hypothetical protein